MLLVPSAPLAVSGATKCIFIYNTKLYIAKIYIQVSLIYKTRITINPTLIYCRIEIFGAALRLSRLPLASGSLPFIPVNRVNVWHIYTPLPARRRPFSATLPPSWLLGYAHPRNHLRPAPGQAYSIALCPAGKPLHCHLFLRLAGCPPAVELRPFQLLLVKMTVFTCKPVQKWHLNATK